MIINERHIHIDALLTYTETLQSTDSSISDWKKLPLEMWILDPKPLVIFSFITNIERMTAINFFSNRQSHPFAMFYISITFYDRPTSGKSASLVGHKSVSFINKHDEKGLNIHSQLFWMLGPQKELKIACPPVEFRPAMKFLGLISNLALV